MEEREPSKEGFFYAVNPEKPKQPKLIFIFFRFFLKYACVFGLKVLSLLQIRNQKKHKP